MIEFKKLREIIRANSKKEINCIPHPFKRYINELPGVMRETITLITASSGIGKSKYARSMYVYEVISFLMKNPQLDLKVKIFYFSLEESKLKFSLSFISRRLSQKYNVNYSVRELLSIIKKENDQVDEALLAKIDSCQQEYDELEKYLEVVEHISSGYGIYKHVQEWLHENGTLKYVQKDGVDLEIDGKKIPMSYQANHPDQYCIVITDQLNLLVPTDKEGTLWEAMLQFSTRRCIRLKKFYKCAVVNIQQQEAAKEKQVYLSDGSTNETKLEPSLDSLGDNKLTQRDADIVLGLFSPHRYGIKMCPSRNGYNIESLKDKFRFLIKLKDRDGNSPNRVGLYFNAIAETFEELPRPEDMILPDNYNKYINDGR
jgi:hypothetical protein